MTSTYYIRGQRPHQTRPRYFKCEAGQRATYWSVILVDTITQAKKYKDQQTVEETVEHLTRLYPNMCWKIQEVVR